MENHQAIKVFRVLKDGLRLWKNNFYSFSQLYLIIYTPILILNIGFLRISHGAPAPDEFWRVSLLVLIIMAWGMWGDIVVITAANQADAGEKIALWRHLGGAIKYFLPYLGVMILVALLMLGITIVGLAGGFGLGGLTVFLYGRLHGIAQTISLIMGIAATIALAVSAVGYLVYFGFRLSLGYYACILEKIGPLAALKRSLALVKKRVNAVIGVFAAFFLAAVVFYLTPAVFLSLLIENPEQLNLAGAICQYALGLVFIPVIRTALLKLYQQLQGVDQAQ